MAQKNRQIVRAFGKTEELHNYRIQWLARIVYSNGFELLIASVITANALALAALTFPGLSKETVDALLLVDEIAYGIFAVELLLRIVSYGKKPWMFFTRGWNIFDFIVVGLSPLFQGQTVILRLLRLFRLIRIFRFLPEVKILSTSIVRSIPPLLSMAVLTTLLLFLYGMAGTYLFGNELPDSWGNIGISMMTLFVMLTLENFPEAFSEGLAVSGVAFPFFLSYMFVIVFTILNILIGVVLNSMDQARKEHQQMKFELADLSELNEMLTSFLRDGKLSESETEDLRSKIRAVTKGSAAES